MAIKLWVGEALQIQVEGLAAVRHELDWNTSFSDQKGRLAKHLTAFAGPLNSGWLVLGVNKSGPATGVDHGGLV